MKKASLHLILLAIALLAVGTWAGAAEEPKTTDKEKAVTTEAQPEKFQPNVMRATDLIGMKVVNRKDEDLGKVEEIVLNPERNKIAYGVLSFGGAMGIGEKYFAVPWTSFEQKPGATALLLDKDKETLKNAPGFDKDKWPDMANPRWRQTLERFYGRGSEERKSMKEEEHATAAGTEPKDEGYRTATADTTPRERLHKLFESRKLSELIGMNVENPDKKHLGELEDVAIDMREGRPVFGIVAISGDKLAPVPWSSLNIQPLTMTALLDADEERLRAVAFDEDKFPNLSSREYASNVYSRFNREPYWSVYGYVSPGEEPEHKGVETRATGWGPGTEYSKKFDPNTVSTIHGKILSVGFFTPERGAGPGERLRIRTDDGKTIIVHLGPRSYLEDQKISFTKGDEVNVTGARAEIRGHHVMIASQVKKGDQTLELRDDQGKPKWTTEGMGKEEKK